MDEINLSIYCTSVDYTKDGRITAISTRKCYDSNVLYSINIINHKIFLEASEYLELITHLDGWTMSVSTATDEWQNDELLICQYLLEASSPGDTDSKIIFYGVLDGVAVSVDTSEILATTKPPKAEMPRLPKD